MVSWAEAKTLATWVMEAKVPPFSDMFSVPDGHFYGEYASRKAWNGKFRKRGRVYIRHVFFGPKLTPLLLTLLYPQFWEKKSVFWILFCPFEGFQTFLSYYVRDLAYFKLFREGFEPFLSYLERDLRKDLLQRDWDPFLTYFLTRNSQKMTKITRKVSPPACKPQICDFLLLGPQNLI